MNAWVDKMGICTVMSLTVMLLTAQTVTQLDTKLAFLNNGNNFCVVMINIQVATSFVHIADTWGLNLEEVMITYG